MPKIDADKDKPTVELKGEEAQKALAQQQKNPFAVIGEAVNNHAQRINEARLEAENIRLDVKANRATMEIFDKRFGLVERQLDNIEKELFRLKNQINEN